MKKADCVWYILAYDLITKANVILPNKLIFGLYTLHIRYMYSDTYLFGSLVDKW